MEEELFLLNISQPYSLANPHSTDVQWSERTYFHNMVNIQEEVIPSFLSFFGGGDGAIVSHKEEELFLLNISQPYSLANPHSTDVQWSERTYFHNMVNKEEVIPTFLSFFGGGDGAIVSHGGRTISFEYFPALQPREPSFNWCSMIRAYIFSQHGQ